MSRSLLFASDLSQENRAAFARALRLAHEQGAALSALHVLDPYLPHRTLHDLEQAVSDDISATLTDLREDYALAMPPLMIQTVVGEPHAEIVREAHERQASLIVLGMHRKRGQKELLQEFEAISQKDAGRHNPRAKGWFDKVREFFEG